MKQKVQHKSFKKLVQYSQARNLDGNHLPIMLTGPAGSSKSHGAEMLAEELGLSFGYLPMNQQSTKSDLLGYLSPNGDEVLSLFAQFYINGGVFVLEELDAANNNVILSINAAIAGKTGYFAGKMHARHKDFILIATANTYGGSDASYIARSKLDASTLSRFLRVEWELDEELEAALINNPFRVEVITNVRKKMKHFGLELSMRDTLSWKTLLDIGEDSHKAAKSTLLRELEPSLFLEFDEMLTVKEPSKDPIELDGLGKEKDK